MDSCCVDSTVWQDDSEQPSLGSTIDKSSQFEAGVIPEDLSSSLPQSTSFEARSHSSDGMMDLNDFSANLVEGSKKHLLFLTALHNAGVTLAPPVVESLRRYVELWLPLVHTSQQQQQDLAKLIPPPDVAWLWHCHRLAPLKYEAYARGRFGCLIEAMPPFAVQMEQSGWSDDDQCCDAKATRDAWRDAYPDQPFFLSEQAGKKSDPLTSRECRMILTEFDLLASMESQSTFLWQVSRPQFQDDDFLRQGVDRYHKFLKLSKFTGKDTVLVPTYQVRRPLVNSF
jgi:Glycine-rich domain-containing protein-like